MRESAVLPAVPSTPTAPWRRTLLRPRPLVGHLGRGVLLTRGAPTSTREWLRFLLSSSC